MNPVFSDVKSHLSDVEMFFLREGCFFLRGPLFFLREASKLQREVLKFLRGMQNIASRRATPRKISTQKHLPHIN